MSDIDRIAVFFDRHFYNFNSTIDACANLEALRAKLLVVVLSYLSLASSHHKRIRSL